jgi:hypothetical protein
MQAGYSMLTDDILPVERLDGEFIARFGYPQMRLWPDEARHFLGTYEELPRAHPAYSKRRVPVGQGGFGSFSCTSIPLACIYLPQRHTTEDQTKIEIARVSQREAIIELVRHSFVAHMTEALGWQPRRLEFFSQLIRTTPVRRLCYPSTFEHLPCVRDAILQDVHSLLA